MNVFKMLGQAMISALLDWSIGGPYRLWLWLLSLSGIALVNSLVPNWNPWILLFLGVILGKFVLTTILFFGLEIYYDRLTLREKENLELAAKADEYLREGEKRGIW